MGLNQRGEGTEEDAFLKTRRSDAAFERRGFNAAEGGDRCVSGRASLQSKRDLSTTSGSRAMKDSPQGRKGPKTAVGPYYRGGKTMKNGFSSIARQPEVLRSRAWAQTTREDDAHPMDAPAEFFRDAVTEKYTIFH